MTVAGMPYIAYLVLLLGMPLLARWRLGLVVALAVTVAELALVWVLAGWLAEPNPYPVRGPPGPLDESPMLQIRRSQGHAHTMFLIWVVMPGAAALIGGGLAVLWSMVQGAWRWFAARR
jgi:hypothetical protein